MSPERLIAKKRDGGSLTPGEIEALIGGFMSGQIADYQLSAWLMASYLKGMTAEETVALTRAMLDSGSKLQHSVPGPTIDKHSTGGVGDKLSLPLAPLAAACGIYVPMISGRGLGHTGGTLDKLEAIEGYRTDLSESRFRQVVRDVGVAIIGQTKRIAPADRRIYALRDVTATVASRPLIVASILSKKLAAGLDGLVFDVKWGQGAFMRSQKEARALARDLTRVSEALGTPARALLTDMNTPLGRMVGNALEVSEAIDILRGRGPEDTTELTLALGVEMLLEAKLTSRRAAARLLLRRALESGAALERFGRMIEAQGGNPRILDRPQLLPRTRRRWAVPAPASGYVQSIDALAIARVAGALGAGRRVASDRVDSAVGVEIEAIWGSSVSAGEPLCFLHARSRTPQLEQMAQAAFALGQRQPGARELVGTRILSKP